MNIALPPELEALITDQVLSGQFDSPEAVVRAGLQLLATRHHERQAALDELESKLLDGLHSPSSPMTAEDWVAIRQDGGQRLRASGAR